MNELVLAFIVLFLITQYSVIFLLVLVGEIKKKKQLLIYLIPFYWVFGCIKELITKIEELS